MKTRFSPVSLKAEGWLRRQLEIQAAGLSGNLDKVWPDVRDSAWIGGDREGWERVPYWLDGFIPLAYELNDEDMIARVHRYMDAILAGQKEDGWICPCTDEERPGYDSWAMQLIGKVLAQYCEYTGDKKAEKALYRAMRCYYDLLKAGTIHLFKWGEYRWFEGFIPLLYLKKRYHEDWITDLARILREQGADYPSFMKDWERPLNRWTFYTHIVNMTMMLKYEAMCVAMFGPDDPAVGDAERLWKHLEKYNGAAVGIFVGDECLGGLNNNRGSELCSVVELMYSCELLYAITGKSVWAERLERAAYNALPATISEDMWTHQYDQMANQIACVKFPGKSFFGTNAPDSHRFGLEPEFGCCTANFNQGWPKLLQSAFLKSGSGIHCAYMLPAELTVKKSGVIVRVRMETEYPFRNSCRYIVEADGPVRFPLSIRVPAWAEAATLNGEPVKGHMIRIDRVWEGKAEYTLEMTSSPKLEKRPGGLVTLTDGPLVFSLPIKARWEMHEYEKDGVERKFPYCDYDLWPESDWAFGFADTAFERVETPLSDVPFSESRPAVRYRVQAAPVEWGMADGYELVADTKPVSRRATGETRTLEWIPYGCTKLRMTELPIIDKSKK